MNEPQPIEPPKKSKRGGVRVTHPNGMSLNSFVQWLGSKGGLSTYTGIRTALMNAEIYSEGEGIPIDDAVPVVFAAYFGEEAKQKLDIERDKARKAAADADTAEINLASLQESLVSRAEMQRAVENMLVTFREKVRAMTDLTLDQRKAVCDALAKLNLDEAAG